MKTTSLKILFLFIGFSITTWAQSAPTDKIPLLWESPRFDIKTGNVFEKKTNYLERLPIAQLWSKYVIKVIKSETDLTGQNVADDVEFFCPNYRKITKDQRALFWGQLIAAVTLPESSWRPTTRAKETGSNFTQPDPITKKHVYSEGLMQLSYQDQLYYKEHFKCGFDYEKDKLLPVNDPKRTILDPYINLRCGLLILNHKVKINRKIVTSNQYWSTLRPAAENKNSKTRWIAKQTKKLKFCVN